MVAMDRAKELAKKTSILAGKEWIGLSQVIRNMQYANAQWPNRCGEAGIEHEK